LEEDDIELLEVILKLFKNDLPLNDLYFSDIFGTKATALHYALFKKKSSALTKLLIEHGACANQRDGEGYTLFDRVNTLQTMRLKKRRQLTGMLIRYGARTSRTSEKQLEKFKQDLLAPLKRKERARWVEKFQTMGINKSLL